MLYQIFRLSVIIALASIVGCAQTGAYRTDYKQSCEYINSGDCDDKAIQEYALGEDHEYRLSFVEFDDQGQLIDREQMRTVLKNYQEISLPNNVLIVVFIHGWHHSAQSKDGNIKSFRGLLRQLSKAESTSKTRRKVLGVYIGWRGESIDIPGINNTTFWDRKNTAHSIGQQGVTELLLRLEEIVNVKEGVDGIEEVDESIFRPDNSKLVTIGHSFGGAALYTSLQQILEDRFINSYRGKTVSSGAKGFGDLVVLMNPAFEALRYATLYDISQDFCRGYTTPPQLPKLAILTSEGDDATGIAFPMGRFFSTVFETHTRLKRHKCNGAGVINQVAVEIDEGEADRQTVGHFVPFLTHRLEPLDNALNRTDKFSFEDLQNDWLNLKNYQSFDFESTRLIHLKGNTVALNPYLNIQVDENLIEGHNDIWHPSIISFLRDLIMIATE